MKNHRVDLPCCEWVIAREYYDGPMSGIGLRSRDQQEVYFRVVAWDEEQWMRLFAISPVDHGQVEHLRNVLLSSGKQSIPFWLPDSPDYSVVEPKWHDLEKYSLDLGSWSLVESHDLLRMTNEVTIPPELNNAIKHTVRSARLIEINARPMLSAFINQLMSPEHRD